jgi:hypothetical protein
VFLAEVVPPAGPVVVPALAGLFIIAACIVAIGMVKLVDAISRAFFGTISGAIAWIPYAGQVVEHKLHKVEQKISHALGSAERSLDSYVAWSWHHMAHLYVWLGHEVASGAETTWQLAQQARHFLMARETYHAIHVATIPLKAGQATLRQDQHNRATEAAALQKSVAQGVYPRLKVGESGLGKVISRDLPGIRAEAKAAERAAANSWRWFRTHPKTAVTGAFLGAVAFALGKLGGGWIRCKPWRRIGHAVCGLPMSLIEGLLGLGLAFAVVIDPRKTAELAVGVEDAMESIIRKIAD